MKLQAFDGGLATRKRPQFIGANQGVVYTNIDNEKGTLTPVKGKRATTIPNAKYSAYYDAKDQWVSADIETEWVEYNKIMYSTDGVAPKKFDGTTTSNLGITPPTYAGTLSKVNDFDQPNEITLTSNTTGGNLPVQNEYYAIVNATAAAQSNALYAAIDEAGSPFFFAAGVIPRFTGTPATRSITIANPTGIAIQSGGVQVYRLYESKYRYVGTLATSSSSITDSVYDISGNAELDESKFGPLQGTYTYQLTYVNSSDGSESAPSPASAEVEVEGEINLTNLPVSSDPQVDKKRLYRIGGNSTAYTRVVELPNSASSYLDSLKDTELEGSGLETAGSGPPPLGLRYLTEAYAMLFAADGNKLRFTPIDQPDSWPPLFFLTYASPITGIASVANGVLVFTKFTAHLVTGTGPNSLATQPLRGDQGCIANNSIQDLGDAAIWASTDGLCISNGNDAKVITKDALGKISLSPVSSALHDEVYYVVNADKSILALDFRYGLVIKQLSLGVETLSVGLDTLYGWAEDVTYEMFAGTISESLTFKSARFVEGRASELKTYKKVYIYSKGDIILNILIDDVQVASRSLTDEGITTVQVPQELQRGAFIQFELSGTGEVYELEYEVGRRQNG